MPGRKRLLLVVAVVMGLLAVLVGACATEAGQAGVSTTVGGSAEVSFDLQSTVLKHLEDSYYEPFDPSALEDDAIKGMVAGLGDPYTVYLDATDYANFSGELAGSYTGVGIAEEMRDGFITTVQVFKGSPAAEAGLRPGDILVSVDGVSTEGMTIDQSAAKILGKSGTVVTLGVYRPPAGYMATTTTTTTRAGQVTCPPPVAKSPADVPPGGTSRTHELTRRTVTEPQVETKSLTAKAKKVAYIKLYIFSKGAAAAIRAAVKQAVEGEEVAAIIFDLRGNGGGLLTEGVEVAGIFIPRGLIVTTRGLRSPERSYEAGGHAYPNIPLYLLVDQGTASASEIVAGALQDHGRAILIGVTTFGKGVVQSIEPLANGGAVKVTTAEYFTPKGRNINEKGITPELIVPAASDVSVDAPLEEALKRIGAR